jgi:hypothetical protein
MAKSGRNLLQWLFDLATFCLMLIGVVGVMLKMLAPDGWLKTWLREIWQFDPGWMLIFIVCALVASLLAKRWLESFQGKKALAGDLVMYVWVAMGLYFVVGRLMTGAW